MQHVRSRAGRGPGVSTSGPALGRLALGCGVPGAHEPPTPFLRAGPCSGSLWGQVVRHFAPLSSGLLESGSTAKMPVFSYMEIIAKKVLVWGKVISFLRVGSLAFRSGGTCAAVWAARAPPPGSASVRKCCACLPGGVVGREHQEPLCGQEGGGHQPPCAQEWMTL